MKDRQVVDCSGRRYSDFATGNQTSASTVSLEIRLQRWCKCERRNGIELLCIPFAPEDGNFLPRKLDNVLLHQVALANTVVRTVRDCVMCDFSLISTLALNFAICRGDELIALCSRDGKHVDLLALRMCLRQRKHAVTLRASMAWLRLQSARCRQLSRSLSSL